MSNSDESAVRPVVGHDAAWGKQPLGGHKIQPYVYTPGSTDTMAVRVREKIDIHGVGTDVVEMKGMFVVRRDSPCPVGDHGPEWGKCVVKTEFRALELYGESPVFGSVRVHLDPEHSSHGEVGPADPGSLAASCVAHCFPRIELPDLGLVLSTAGKPVALASKVVQIPPVGDVARSENSALLVDEHRNVVGEIISSDIEVGEVIYSVPLGTSGPGERGGEGPSGQGFYTRRPDTVCLSPTNPAREGGAAGHAAHGGARVTAAPQAPAGARGTGQVRVNPRGGAPVPAAAPAASRRGPVKSLGAMTRATPSGGTGAPGKLEGQLQELINLIQSAVTSPQGGPQPAAAGSQDAIDAAVFRRLVTHLRGRPDVTNDALMQLADFCRECISKWYQAASSEHGAPVSLEEARTRIYGASARR